MLAGKPYRPDTEELKKISSLAHRLSRDYNITTESRLYRWKKILKKCWQANHIAQILKN
ncbi:maltose acetyltransferase domain-containing protein [Lactobacillus crispatus]|uniref:maltose acetyltransferase domain-containing protein n=1 Tax=Lactobacillus crispatus TaxID=47770 RepID=UPI0021510687|nr:maltose acetyltransferase domain-containing protein [Lactobacillus crispatus]